jgi:tetratricopeptide (TPR) repeat protein/predicted Ser/Thr protein kinase
MTTVRTPAAEREERLQEILLAYLEAVEAGQQPDRRSLLERHPDLAAELSAFFAEQDRLDRWAEPLRVVAAARGATPPLAAGETVRAPDTPPAQAGLRIGGYELLEEIGRGGMGVVWKARQEGANRVVAVKLVRPDPLGGEEQVRRFRNEAEIVAQLDHRHIVPLYDVGEYGGAVYFSMKLLDGGSLADRLSHFTADPRAAARIVAEVARAVHHAHQRGVLHRDLKPSNILLDADGRPHVTDFGLAKRIEVDSSLTQSGALVGTPSYMAPEQTSARKGAVTTATDVHGLGAVLYALLTGRPPFQAETVLETLEQVKSRDPDPPRSRSPRVDPDLETVCLKCLQKEPERRYVSAEAVADDLQRWLDGQPLQARPLARAARFWRWCRRNPVVASLAALSVLLLVTMAAGAVVSIVLLSHKQSQTEAAYQAENSQRQLADERLLIALRVIDDMYLQVAQKWLADEPHMTQVQREFLLKTVERYQELARANSTDPRLRGATGHAYLRVGDIEFKLGHLGKAEQAYGWAIQQFRVLTAESPAASEFREELGLSLVHLGNVFKEVHRIPEARACYREAIALKEQLVDSSPNEAKYRVQLGGTLHNVACILTEQGQLAEAEGLLNQAIRRQQEALELAPGDQFGREFLCNHYSQLAYVRRARGNEADAEKYYRQAVAWRQKLVDDFPSVAEYRSLLAGHRSDLAVSCKLNGKIREAEEAFRLSAAAQRELVRDFPAVRDYRKRLAVCCVGLGNLLQQQNQPGEAEQVYREAVGLYEKLAAEFPSVPEYASRLAAVHTNLVPLFAAAERYPEAEQSARRAVELFQDMARRFPNLPEYRLNLARSYRNLAGLLLDSNREKAAVKADEQAVDICQKLLAEFPAMPACRGQLLICQYELAWLLVTCRDPEVRDPIRGNALAKQTVERAPRVAAYWNTRGIAEYRLGGLAAAKTSLMKAMELDKGGNAFEWYFLAMVEWRLGDKEQARKWYDQAVAWSEKHRPRHGELVRFRAEAAGLLGIKDPLGPQEELPRKP